MKIYNAIMKAADHIEQNPNLFNFHKIKIPSCGTPGCAVGWIGYFLGAEPGALLSTVCRANEERPIRGIEILPDLTQRVFYIRMNALGYGWDLRAKACARNLRLYAEKYHGHEKPKSVTAPDWKAMSAKWTVGDDMKSQDACHV